MCFQPAIERFKCIGILPFRPEARSQADERRDGGFFDLDQFLVARSRFGIVPSLKSLFQCRVFRFLLGHSNER